MRVIWSVVLSLFIIASAASGQGTVVLVPEWSSGLTPPRVGPSPAYKGLPYSAKGIHTGKGRADGSTIAYVEQSLVYRDAEGRTRVEVTQNQQIMQWIDKQGQSHTLDVTKMNGGDIHAVTVDDPVAGVSLFWTTGNPSAKKQVTVSHPARTAVSPNSAGTAVSNPPVTTPRDSIEVMQSKGSHIEGLGMQTINGLYAEGYRLTEVLIGTNVTVTTEEWLSPDLKIVVRKINTDPRRLNADLKLDGVDQFDLTGIERSDPDPALFNPPEGYEMFDPRAQHNTHP